jgi:hypothetical protein
MPDSKTRYLVIGLPFLQPALAFAHGGGVLLVLIGLPITVISFALAVLFAESLASKKIFRPAVWIGLGIVWVVIYYVLAGLIIDVSINSSISSAALIALYVAPLLAVIGYLGWRVYRLFQK